MRFWLFILMGLILIARIAGVKRESLIKARIDEGGVRKALQLKIMGWLPGDPGALASGLLLGGDEDLSPGAANNFRSAGLTHITAASGYNVVVVAGWIMAALTGFVGRRKTLYYGIVCVILYMWLAGMTVPVIRAGLMVVLGYTGLLLGRKSDAWWSFVLTCTAMLIFRPEWAFDVSFQLSATATAGVMMAGVSTSKTDSSIWRNSLAADLRTTLGAWLFTLPIILHWFGSLSLVAPMANAAVAWAIAPVMEVLGAAMAVGMVWDTGGWLVSLMAWPGLKYMLEAARWFASWPGASISVAKMSWYWVIVYYLAGVLVASKLRRNEE